MGRIILTFALLLSSIFLAVVPRKVDDYDYGRDSYIKMVEAIEQARARIQSLGEREVFRVRCPGQYQQS